ncbi:MAG: NAD(P)H-hydrate dehydratase [Thiobacillus sp.]|nr:NAD(P)H-hydrate dehydratase [Thiobacillus sp.]
MMTPLDALGSPAVYDASHLRILEQRFAAAHSDQSLMDRAGAAVAELAGSLARDTGEPILILAGPGNNGGDALIAASRLQAHGFRVVVTGRPQPGLARTDASPSDAPHAWADWLARGGVLLDRIPHPQRFSLVIDGLFGIGLRRDVTGVEAGWIEQANGLGCPRLAVDIPSGLDSDSGRVRGCAFRAHYTLTFLGLKPGLLTADGPDHAGLILLDTLDIDPALRPATPGMALTQLAGRHILPPRKRNSHKGTFGHVAIIGGDPGMVGACLIAGRAALEHGAGSVTLGALDARIVVDYGEPRLMFSSPERVLTQSMQTLAVGPGLGHSARAYTLLESALAIACPLVLDADALTLLADHTDLVEGVAGRRSPTLLTPHPGEAARLLNRTVGDIQAGRIEAALALSQNFNAHVALKGAGTVIAHPDGRYVINTSGGPWLAQAGSGDRLTGMVAALLGQGLDAGDALEAAVWLHGAPSLGSQTA